jgi:hypothetical protein
MVAARETGMVAAREQDYLRTRSRTVRSALGRPAWGQTCRASVRSASGARTHKQCQLRSASFALRLVRVTPLARSSISAQQHVTSTTPLAMHLAPPTLSARSSTSAVCSQQTSQISRAADGWAAVEYRMRTHRMQCKQAAGAQEHCCFAETARGEQGGSRAWARRIGGALAHIILAST